MPLSGPIGQVLTSSQLQWAAGTTWVDFEDVKVPVENIIGKEGEGFKILMTNFNHVRVPA